MKQSLSIGFGMVGLVVLLSGCQHPQTSGGTTSGSGTSAATSSSDTAPGREAPVEGLEACLANIGDVSPGQRMLAEATCERNAKAQAAMDNNPGDYLPPAK